MSRPDIRTRGDGDSPAAAWRLLWPVRQLAARCRAPWQGDGKQSDTGQEGSLEPPWPLNTITSLLYAARYTFLFGGVAYLLWQGALVVFQGAAYTVAHALEASLISVVGPGLVWIAAKRGEWLVEEVRRLARESRSVAEVAHIVTSTLDIEQVYQKFALEMKRLVDFDCVTIITVNNDAGTLTFKYRYGPALPGRDVGVTRSLEGSRTQHIIVTGRTFIQRDLAQECVFPADGEHLEKGMRSSIGVPLVSRGDSIGVLHLYSHRSGAFGPGEQDILERLARQITPAVENANLYHQLQARVEEEEVMAEIGRTISSSLNIDEVYSRFATQVRRLVPFDRISVVLLSREDGTLLSTYSAGAEVSGRGTGNTYPLSGSITERAIRDGGLVVVQGLDREGVEREMPGILPAFDAGIRSIIGVPLYSNDQPIGTLVLCSATPYAYNEQHARLAEAVGTQIAGAIASAQLYAQRLRAESALRQSEARFRNLVESAPDGIFIVDDGGFITLVNSRAEDMFRYSRDELLGAAMESVVPELSSHAADERPSEGHDAADLQTGSGLETSGRRKDGTEFPVDVTLSQVQTNEGLMNAAMVRDITTRKEEKERIQEASRLASIGELAAGVAHEINNPLTGVLGYSQVLLSEDLPQALREDIQKISADAERAATIVQNLLSFARKRDQERRYICLNSVVNLALNLKAHDFKVNNIEVTVRLATDLPYTMADESQMVQAILNILSNGEQAMNAAYGGGRMLVSTSASDDHVRVSISDNGPGIPPEHQHRIFEPFFTTKEVGTGTGLGLSTCYGIVCSHDGQLYFENRREGGATFHIVLPIVEAEGDESTPDPWEEAVLLEPKIGRWGERELV